MNQYLYPSEYIDWQHPDVLKKADILAEGLSEKIHVAKACFEWVRDNIRHTSDSQDNTITCRASDVLLAETGYCYAKSHLLSALLRANEIPAGLCYQRLSDDETGPHFCLHGLNAVYLAEFGWYRIDPRGNKTGIHAEFCPPTESLAYSLKFPGETDFPEIWPEPLPMVVKTLQMFKTYKEVNDNLPDVALINMDS